MYACDDDDDDPDNNDENYDDDNVSPLNALSEICGLLCAPGYKEKSWAHIVNKT